MKLSHRDLDNLSDQFETVLLETGSLVSQGFQPLKFSMPAKIDLGLTSIKGHNALISGWKESENGFVFRLVFETPNGRVPKNGIIAVNLPTNPQAGELDGKILEHGMTNYGLDYLHCELETDEQTKEAIATSFQLRKSDQTPLDKNLNGLGKLAQHPLLNIRIWVGGLVAGALACSPIFIANRENDQEACHKLSEGASLLDGKYKLIRPSFRQNKRPKTTLEKFLAKPGTTPAEMVDSCRDSYDMVIPLETAEESFRKTELAKAKLREKLVIDKSK